MQPKHAIRLQLENLFVERRGLRIKAFFVQVIGDADVLVDGLVGLLGANVEITERIGGVPVVGVLLHDAQILRNGGVELARPEQFLGVAKRGGAVDGHFSKGLWSCVGVQSIVSNSVGGRNVRLWTSE